MAIKKTLIFNSHSNIFSRGFKLRLYIIYKVKRIHDLETKILK